MPDINIIHGQFILFDSTLGDDFEKKTVYWNKQLNICGLRVVEKNNNNLIRILYSYK